MIALYLNRKRFRQVFRNFHDGSFKPDITRGGMMEVKIIYDTWSKCRTLVSIKIKMILSTKKDFKNSYLNR